MPTFKIPRLRRPWAPARPEVASVYVEEARKRPKEGKTDTDALFTLAAWHAVHGENQKALALLHRLTQLEPAYPGVWRAKAAAAQRGRGREIVREFCEADGEEVDREDEHQTAEAS